MKRILLIWLIILGASLRAQAQGEGFSAKGSHQVQAGYGLISIPAIVLNRFSDKLNYRVSLRGPYHFRYQYQFHKRWSVGASVNYSRYRATWEDVQLDPTDNVPVKVDFDLTMNSISTLVRLQFYPVVREKWEMYVGASLGGRFNAYTLSASVPWANAGVPGVFPIGAESVLGFRYYPVENFGLYTEIGLAKSPIQLGLVFRVLKE